MKARRSLMKVAAVQMKFRRTIPENVAFVERHIAEFAQSGGDAILFPEAAITGYNTNFRKLDPAAIEAGLRIIAGAARTHHCNVLVGSPTRARGRWFNSLLVSDRRGRVVFRYHKIHLTPRDATFFTPGNVLAFSGSMACRVPRSSATNGAIPNWSACR